MLSKLKNNNNEGFTIIEVLIVLAIAGLILLIVFLAVPALQRNATNTNRKNDASSVAAAVSEYENNNNGALPGKIGTNATSGTYEFCAAADNATCSNGTDSPSQFKVGHYNTPNANGGNGDFEIANPGTALGQHDQLFIEEKATCSGNAVVTTGATGAQSVALAYTISNGTNYSDQCITAS
jgi:prepilin-type N-terminal cleavage/methylation domain-containing protein